MGGRVLRYEVPIDDEWHTILSRQPLFVGCRRINVVEFWAEEYLTRPNHEKPDVMQREFEYRVFGTGHDLGNDEFTTLYMGTAYAGIDRQLVWHLYRRPIVQ